MLKYLTIFLLLMLLNGCNKKREETTLEKYGNPFGIEWVKDLPTAFQKAKIEHKIVLVMVVSQGCRWCIKMEKETLANSKVKKKLQKYILVMADRETPSEKEQLPPFKHVPILFFLNENREELDNLRGYFSAEDFLDYLNEFEEE